MTLVKFANGNKGTAVNPWFNDVFGSLINDSFVSDKLSARTPAVNIAENENGYQIELAAPGLKKEDFKISLDKNILSVSAEIKTEELQETKKYNRREYNFTSFVRSFSLPESADHAKIEAEYNQGILNVFVAKKEESKNLSREIEIK